MKTRLVLILLTVSLMFSAASAQEYMMKDDPRFTPLERNWADRVDQEPTIEEIQELFQQRESGISFDSSERTVMGWRRPTFHFFYALMSGWHVIPEHRTPARGAFLAQVNDEYTEIDFMMYLWRITNLTVAHIHLGGKDENGPPVATIYGPDPPGMGLDRVVFKGGVITEEDLIGPLAGQPLSALVEAMAAGEAYVNVHTDDGEDGDNTGVGDYVSGEIRGQIRLVGTVPEPPKPETARLQVIHNAADPAAEVVDIYVNGEMFKDDFGFREATPYLDVPANVELAIGVAPGTSTGPGDILATIPVTLTADKTYVAVANGVLDPAGFSANPDGRDIGFTLFAKEGAREAAMDMGSVEFFALHGA
ncbi:MAG: CHRD domain-containing protein, partial [Candidatus Latescibacteria bacterium]|nr:CHRD domain-containing protein [bacterium]MBD3423040.1 CHRD domain-containing protein [Candidatus Latescibacterota bacterium]